MICYEFVELDYPCWSPNKIAWILGPKVSVTLIFSCRLPIAY